MTQTNNLKLSLPEGGDKVDVAVLRTNFTALDGVLGDHANRIAAAVATIGAHGHNCRIAYGTYAGNSTFGAGAPTTIVTGFRPVYALVGLSVRAPEECVPMMRGFAQATSRYTGYNTNLMTWGEDRMSWYTNDGNSETQLNKLNNTYCYFVVGCEA